jgi:hypothetical protein
MDRERDEHGRAASGKRYQRWLEELPLETNRVRIPSKPFTPDGLAAAVEEAMVQDPPPEADGELERSSS